MPAPFEFVADSAEYAYLPFQGQTPANGLHSTPPTLAPLPIVPVKLFEHIQRLPY